METTAPSVHIIRRAIAIAAAALLLLLGAAGHVPGLAANAGEAAAEWNQPRGGEQDDGCVVARASFSFWEGNSCA